MEMHDLTGRPPSENDVREASQAIRVAVVRQMFRVPPELAVQLPNILRCLEHYEQLRNADSRTFEQVWAEKEAAGFQYGEDALEQVRFGWNLARGTK